MKEKNHLSFVIILSLLLLSCTQQSSEKQKAVAKINNFVLPVKEFEEKLVQDLNVEPDFKLTKGAKKDFLEQLIREELLVQEAVRLKLDREDEFIRAIERFWKATLIRDVMELKSRSIDKTTYVSQEEIDAYYADLKKTGLEPADKEDIRDYIIRELKEKKKSEKLKEWIEDLRKNARVEIDQETLFEE
ncbi:MAG: SurA N-terminal domain-containing protein [Pseudomonadota bacterium]